MNAFPALLLSLIIAVSGCTVPGTNFVIPFPGFGPTVSSEESDIVVIEDLSAIPNMVSPGQPVKLITFVKNSGTTSIPLPQMESGRQITVELFDYCKGLFDIQRIGCSSASDMETCTIPKLLPGQAVEVDWFLVSNPVELKTVCPSDGMKVLVRYPYRTESLTTIQFINQEELQQQIERGTLKPVESYITLGEGTIKPKITVEDKQPIAIVNGGSGPGGLTVVALQIENTGRGFLRDGKIPVNNIKIDFKSENIQPMLDDECALQHDSGTVYKPKTGDLEDGVEYVKLIKDKSPKLFCKLRITENVPQITTQTISVVITEYEYEFRDSEKVTVEPKF